MAARKLYDIAAKTGEYTAQSGEKKGRWQNVGAVMQADDGNKFIMLARWFSPAGVPDLSGKGGESILLSMFEPKQQDGAAPAPAPRPSPAPAPSAGFDEDVPF